MLTLRTSPTLWYCAADYVLAKGESIPLILLEEPARSVRTSLPR
jgi:hypothetical protein